MANNPTMSRDRFRKVVRSLLATKSLDEADSEEIVQQYDAFLDHIPAAGSDNSTGFNQYKDRVDTFLMDQMSSPRFEKLQKNCEIIAHTVPWASYSGTWLLCEQGDRM